LVFPFFVIFGCISVFSIATYTVEKGHWQFLNKLSPTSFFIYLAHIVAFTPLTNFAVNKIVGTSNALLMSMGYLVTPFIIICECLVLYTLLKRFLPSICNFLTGNR
jgi:glycopeptide antibiotics resistance protein